MPLNVCSGVFRPRVELGSRPPRIEFFHFARWIAGLPNRSDRAVLVFLLGFGGPHRDWHGSGSGGNFFRAIRVAHCAIWRRHETTS